jgi:ATP-dependent DNA helicase Q1
MQIAEDAAMGKSMSKKENELVIAHMLYEGYLQFDFGYTAYAANTYLRATQAASQLLQGMQCTSGRGTWHETP